MASFSVSAAFRARDMFSGPVQAMARSTSAFASRTEIASARAQRALRSVNGTVSRLEGSMLGLKNLSSTFLGPGAIIGAGLLAKNSLDAAKNFDSISRSIDFATKGLGDEAISRVRAINNEFGLANESGLEGFKTLSGSVRGLNYSLDQTTDIYESVGMAARAMGVSADNQRGIFLALSQVASKGTVQAEELRGQIGERLPGAFGIAAKAMGVTEQQLGKMMEKGELMAKDFLPKFAKALRKDFGDAATDAASSPTATWQRFLNMLEMAQIWLGQKLLPTVTGFMQKMMDSKSELIAWGQAAWAAIKGFGTALKGTLVFVWDIVSGIGSLVSQFSKFVGITGKSAENAKSNNSLFRVMGEILGTLAGIYLTFRVGLMLTNGVMAITNGLIGVYNVATGIMGAVTGVASIRIGQSRAAMIAYRVTLAAGAAATWLVNSATSAWAAITATATAVQWKLNAALTANPIGLIIVAVGALIALISVIIAKWDEWGAALSVFMGPVGLIISGFMAIRDNWQSIVDAFQTGGILEGLKRIGVVMFDMVLKPLQQILEVASNIPGVGDWAAEQAGRVEAFRSKMDLQTDGSGAEVARMAQEDSGVERMGRNDIQSESQITREEIRQMKTLNVNFAGNTRGVSVFDEQQNPIQTDRTFEY